MTTNEEAAAMQECVRLEGENRKLRQAIQLGAEQLKASRAHTEMLQRAAQSVSLPDRATLENVLDAHEQSRSTFNFELSCGRSYCSCGWTTEIGLDDTYGTAAYTEHFQAVLAALSTQPAAGEVEWEYGVRYTNHPAGDTVFPTDEEVAMDLAEESNGGVVAMQRETHHGPWVEVQPEPQPTELANLFPGTLAALDNLNIRPETGENRA